MAPNDETLVNELIRQRAERLGRTEAEVRAEMNAEPATDDLEQRAKALKWTEEQLREWDHLVLRQAPYPRPECLKAPEITALVHDEASLSSARRAHYETCGYCRTQAAMARPDRSQAAEVGVRMAEVVNARPAVAASRPAPLAWVHQAGGFLGGVALILVIWIDTGPLPYTSYARNVATLSNKLEETERREAETEENSRIRVAEAERAKNEALAATEKYRLKAELPGSDTVILAKATPYSEISIAPDVPSGDPLPPPPLPSALDPNMSFASGGK